jgi:hypothetical protein
LYRRPNKISLAYDLYNLVNNKLVIQAVVPDERQVLCFIELTKEEAQLTHKEFIALIKFRFKKQHNLLINSNYTHINRNLYKDEN